MTKAAAFTEMIERTVSEILKGIGTSIPGIIDSFSLDTQLAKIQVGVQFIDIQGKSFAIAPIVNVPVHFPGGSYSIEYQIDSGMEGLIIISQRCIDAWKEQGGIATQPILRKLDMQDALFIPGFRSKPNKLAGFENNGIRLRNPSADKFIWLKNDGTAAITVDTLTITGNIEHSGDTNQTGNTTVSGTAQAATVTATAAMSVNSIQVLAHKHKAGSPPGDTGVME